MWQRSVSRPHKSKSKMKSTRTRILHYDKASTPILRGPAGARAAILFSLSLAESRHHATRSRFGLASFSPLVQRLHRRHNDQISRNCRESAQHGNAGPLANTASTRSEWEGRGGEGAKTSDRDNYCVHASCGSDKSETKVCHHVAHSSPLLHLPQTMAPGHVNVPAPWYCFSSRSEEYDGSYLL